MSDDTNFGENPFRALAGKQFPSGRKQGGSVVTRKAAKKSVKTEPTTSPSPLADEDTALFYEAMSRVETVRHSDSKGKGFALQEHCSLPDSLKLAKKSKAKVKWETAEKMPAQTASGKAALAQCPPSNGPDVRHADLADQTGQGDDSAMFLRAMGQVDPLQKGGRDVAPAPASRQAPATSSDDLQTLLESNLEFALSFTDEYLEGHVVGLDQMTMNKLRAGALSPEAHLDLHGLNVVQAFEALRGFMRGAWYKGLRTVLIVPGRGRNSPDGMGVLRGKLQAWLTQEPFKRVVLAFCTAQPHDGGPGSVYVLLRKYRKKGRIYWERMPADADLYEQGK